LLVGWASYKLLIVAYQDDCPPLSQCFDGEGKARTAETRRSGEENPAGHDDPEIIDAIRHAARSRAEIFIARDSNQGLPWPERDPDLSSST
jgi:hypothetical protein